MRIYIKFLIKNVYAADPCIVLYLLAVEVVIISFGTYIFVFAYQTISVARRLSRAQRSFPQSPSCLHIGNVFVQGSRKRPNYR